MILYAHKNWNVEIQSGFRGPKGVPTLYLLKLFEMNSYYTLAIVYASYSNYELVLHAQYLQQ